MKVQIGTTCQKLKQKNSEPQFERKTCITGKGIGSKNKIEEQ